MALALAEWGVCNFFLNCENKSQHRLKEICKMFCKMLVLGHLQNSFSPSVSALSLCPYYVSKDGRLVHECPNPSFFE